MNPSSSQGKELSRETNKYAKRLMMPVPEDVRSIPSSFVAPHRTALINCNSFSPSDKRDTLLDHVSALTHWQTLALLCCQRTSEDVPALHLLPSKIDSHR